MGIGLNGTMPWPNLKTDLKYFKKCTNGQDIMVGRKTFEHLPDLPNRNIIVATRDNLIPICLKYERSNTDLWVIGGGEIYLKVLRHFHVQEIHLTRILYKDYLCDTFFPGEWNPLPKYMRFLMHTVNQDGLIYIIEKYERL